MIFPSPDRLPSTPAGQQESIEWLHKHSGLHQDRARECLEARQWSRVGALCSFVQSRSSIPATYYESTKPTIDHSVVNDLVFEAYCRVHQLQKQSSSPEGECWSALASNDWVVQKALAVLKPDLAKELEGAASAASTGPFLQDAFFVKAEIEGRAPLFNQHTAGWLQRNRDALSVRTKKWVEDCGKLFAGVPLTLVPIADAEKDKDIPRIIIMDCVRTFFQEQHRKRLATFLHSLWKENNQYGQAMSYVGGILLLTLDENEAATLMRRASKEYIPGHWAAEAVGFATNAYVWDLVLKEVDPVLHDHFKSIGFLPDTYLQKIFNGLCIHVLDFDLMYDFMELFFQEGFMWLLRFATALALKLKPQLLKCQASDMATLYSLMRMDAGAVSRADAIEIMANAKALDVKAWSGKIDDFRMKSYNDVIEPRMKKVPKEEAFEPCALCEKNKPTLMCDECGAICAGCHKGALPLKSKDGSKIHSAKHDVSDW